MRYVKDAPRHFAALREAAEKYPDLIAADSGLEWMRRKPFDPAPGHPHFFNGIYAAANILQAMALAPNALIVEVGSGPGWMTQILVGLGYRVVAIEPSATMNELARQRVTGFHAMTGVAVDDVTFLTATLEEADLAPYYGRADAVIFFEALHHVIDEFAAMRQAFALLRPGGCLAVCGEGRWNPGDVALEGSLDEEMKRYGTLESPFTQDYLRHVLLEAGFEDIEFHHSVNGLFAESQEQKTIRDVANPSTLNSNTVLAWRLFDDDVPRLTQFPDRTKAELTLLSEAWEADYVTVKVRVKNLGETYWPAYRPSATGGVTLALAQGDVAPPPKEATNRAALTTHVLPGHEAVIDWRFDTRGLDKSACCLRLVAEGAFWFADFLPLTANAAPSEREEQAGRSQQSVPGIAGEGNRSLWQNIKSGLARVGKP
jgi:SAM-dependent methyltransferase